MNRSLTSKKAQVTGFELACDQCPVVLVTNLEWDGPLPRHRCGQKVGDFNVVLPLDELTQNPSRIDLFWCLD